MLLALTSRSGETRGGFFSGGLRRSFRADGGLSGDFTMQMTAGSTNSYQGLKEPIAVLPVINKVKIRRSVFLARRWEIAGFCLCIKTYSIFN
ncbi:hypothetical protein QS306_05200 [Paraburkholderia bonniea]|uniref:hypothetical protein n=1 Tax=Paraburkholderia bonniea TaxID=2152891 RepID=UPI001291E097|nr:hypothetical protein [Paraburkholderia bonniea]WJF91050.1 hypothetical protein QS306_05200 [Paraburkholderia bonniea]WJF94364.1 hypothetical protein QS308_05205 [Paraburkholderia bonniea]